MFTLVGLLGSVGCSDLKNNAVGPAVIPGQTLTFAQDIRPLLQQNCAACHSGATAKGQYDLSSLAGVVGSGSDNVANAIAGNAQSALLTVLDASSHAQVANATIKTALRKWVVEDSLGFKTSLVHPEGWTTPSSANFHGKSIAASGYDMAGCRSCHGQDYQGGITQSSCTTCHTPSPEECSTCHGTGVSAAPPLDLSGNFGTQNRGVGAHQAHLNGGSLFKGMACEQCHQVPAAVSSPGHLDGNRVAEVKFSGLAVKNASANWNGTTCNNTYCHGSAAPKWTSVGTGEASCGTCHGRPPALPHPQVENCSLCHGEVVDVNGVIVNKTLHVNGRVEFKFGHPEGFAKPTSANFHGFAIRDAGWSMKECQACHGQNYAGSSITSVSCLTCHTKSPEDCSTCHGSATNAAPPPNLNDQTATTFRTVGAHQAHLQARFFTNAIACSECHRVPSGYYDAGHIDSNLPAEVTFGSVATSDGAKPVWTGQTCSNTNCHGSDTPSWTLVGTGVACGSCHGLPPALPHPQVSQCSLCHERVVDNNRNIINKALHLNGKVEVGP